MEARSASVPPTPPDFLGHDRAGPAHLADRVGIGEVLRRCVVLREAVGRIEQHAGERVA